MFNNIYIYKYYVILFLSMDKPHNMENEMVRSSTASKAKEAKKVVKPRRG